MRSTRKHGLLVLSMFTAFFVQAQAYLPEMVFVKGGTFTMGNSKAGPDEAPEHKVTLSDFYIGKYEITVEQYRQFCKEANYRFPSAPSEPDWYEEHYEIKKWVWKDRHPVVKINWFDASAYCKWLSKKTGKKYRLPTEAEWEYVAKGGSKSKGYSYSGSNNLSEVAWFDETTYERGTMPVGTLKANELGIHDLNGNAWEWCLDYFDMHYYKKSPKVNPKGPKNGQFRVIRGGSWYYVSDMATTTGRDGPYPEFSNWNYGFRVVRER